MNKFRRKEIMKIILQLNKILSNLSNYTIEESVKLINDILIMLTDVFDDEEMAMDNTPENLQGSSRYEESEYACEVLSESIEELEEIDEYYSKSDIEYKISGIIDSLSNCI